MKLTRYDRGEKPDLGPRPGWGGAAAWIGKITRAGKCRDAGLNPRALNTWRLRHPESTLSDDEVIALIVENKRRWCK